MGGAFWRQQCLSSRRLPPLQSAAMLQVSILKEPRRRCCPVCLTRLFSDHILANKPQTKIIFNLPTSCGSSASSSAGAAGYFFYTAVIQSVLCTSVQVQVKHSLKYFVTGSSGVPNIPEFMGVLVFNGIQAGYCDSNNMTLKPKQDWAKKILQTNPEQKGWYDHMCFMEQPNFFKNMISYLKQFTKSEGVHVLQRIGGCERDENTGELTGLVHFGYNGEDFLEFNLETLTWIALKPEADLIRQEWDADRVRTKHNENFLTQICPEWLKTYVESAKSPLQKSGRIT
ncbi:major histocompatibility complex class I-related gene protein [Haplochromis burtoni]|uniref:major histocompatibility complex class I-related gene protein n=1 Tax=Haplochromis burtoni TaxID=8153 RepID=UPI001C2DE0EE|nr:major histocompatibility complex class I-related gene protein [Haplochromis burtoni]